MVNAIKQGYVNPLAMMKQGKQTNHFQVGVVKKAEKRQKDLEAKKQSIQNSLLLMKGTSGDSGASKENIELLEKKLEEVTVRMKSEQQELTLEPRSTEKIVQESSLDMVANRKNEKNNFDRFSKTASEEPNDNIGY